MKVNIQYRYTGKHHIDPALLAEAQLREFKFKTSRTLVPDGTMDLSDLDICNLFNIPRGDPYKPTKPQLSSAITLAQKNAHMWARDRHIKTLHLFQEAFRGIRGDKQQHLTLGFIEAVVLAQDSSVGEMPPRLHTAHFGKTLRHTTTSGRIMWEINAKGDVILTVHRAFGTGASAVPVPMMSVRVPYTMRSEQFPRDSRNGVVPQDFLISRINKVETLPLTLIHIEALWQQVHHLLSCPLHKIDFHDLIFRTDGLLTETETASIYSERLASGGTQP